MNAVTPITTEQVDAILDRFEQGKVTLEEVNCVRNVLRALRAMARDVYLQPCEEELDEEPT
jgi:hypothetical protein